jgi:6-phosphogluconolactonase
MQFSANERDGATAAHGGDSTGPGKIGDNLATRLDPRFFEKALMPGRRQTLATALLVLLAMTCVDSPKPVRAESASWLFASLLREKKILTYMRMPVSGKLVRLGETKTPAEPAHMNVSPDRRTLFVSFRSTGQLASYRIHPANGSLVRLSVVAGGEDPAFMQPDSSGRFLISAYYRSNNVTVHTVDKQGRISERPLQTVATAEKAHGVAIDSKDRFVFVSHTGGNRVHQFAFDKQRGFLKALDPTFVARPKGEHPRHIVMHPSDRWAYTSNEAGDSLGVYAVDGRSGVLTPLQTLSSLPDGFDKEKNATARCEITPNGKNVYVANRGHESIACYAINQKTGRVRSLGQVPTEKTPRSFTIDPRGRYLYAAGESSGRIASFLILNDGMLERFATDKAGPVAWWVIAVDTPIPQ